MNVKAWAAAVLLVGVLVASTPAAALAPIPLPPGEYSYEVRPGLSTTGYWAWGDYPYYVPLKTPIVVVAAKDIISANFTGPVTLTIETPTGSFERILMRVDVWMESAIPGRPAVNYDRPLWVWVNGAPAFIGTTVQRFNETAFQDVTYLYPLLVGGGTVNVTVALPNWVLPSWGLTGIFHVRVTLLYYPGPKPPYAPDEVIPLWINPSWGVARAIIRPGKEYASQLVDIPAGTYRAALIIYTEGASYDEFFYYQIPPDRYVIVEANGTTVAFVQPYPYMYTGSLNPLLWRPVPGVRTLAFEPHFIDLTPLMGVIGTGTVNFTVTVYNTLRYWNVFAALLLYIDEDVVYSEYKQIYYDIEGPVRDENTTVAWVTEDNVTVYNYTLSYSYMKLEAASVQVHWKYWGQRYTVAAEGSMYNFMAATQIYDENEEWSNLTLIQTWSYNTTVYMPFRKIEWSETWQGSLDSKYGFVISAPIPENPEDYPVEGNFTLYTELTQTLKIDRMPHLVTGTYRSLEESVNATGFINGTIRLISPTAGIITGITGTYGENVKTITGSEQDPRVYFQFTRMMHGWNEWPQWSILEDKMSIKYG